MKIHNQSLSISPTDLSNFLSCRYRSALDLSAAQGVRKKPVRNNPVIETLMELGLEHEREYVRRLEQSATTVLNLDAVQNRELALKKTDEAIRAGVDVIVQAALSHGSWYGRPDILLKVSKNGTKLGAWCYEPVDAKLARETRGGTIMQLGLYCELLDKIQGQAPEWFHVVAPGPGGTDQVRHSYRFQEYSAYFRLMKAKLERAIAIGHAELEQAVEAEPVDHCMVCPWWGHCRDWWRETDHLSLVAGITRLQRRELPRCGISTVVALAEVDRPFPFKPDRGSIGSYERVRDQARVQVQTRKEAKLVYEIITPPTGGCEDDYFRSHDPVGLARLPEPSAGDIFLDLEGDPLAVGVGRDYLFGLVYLDSHGNEEYRHWWADNPQEERRAFEEVVDLIMERLDSWPNMHVYHYAPYEKTALRRLMGRYATRAEEVDRLLRGKRLVDLYAVVRRGVRVGVERSSIKNLEPLYGFEREVDLRDASRALGRMEQALELRRLEIITPALRSAVQGYNRDDCVSTRRLRDWLEARRTELISSGVFLDRPKLADGSPSEKVDESAQEVAELRTRLLIDVPDDPEERNADQQARFLLAYLLDWHWREEKSGWWEYYRLIELPPNELLEESKAVAGLEHLGVVGKEKRSQVHRFRYPPQDIEVKIGEQAKTQAEVPIGKVYAHDGDNRFLDLVIGPSKQRERPTELIFHTAIGAKAAKDALLELGKRAVECGGVAALPSCPQRAILMNESPSLTSGQFSPPSRDSELSTTDYAVSIVTQLDRTALAIQGPPGAGKTFTGARMVLAAVKAGLKIGVTANSHKVIRNLLDGIQREAHHEGVDFGIGHKSKSSGAGSDENEAEHIQEYSENAEAAGALESGEVRVLGGTAWLWARPEFQESVDILLVDEAGQFALANVMAGAQAAQSLVLLGDPQQLEQPTKGSHPDGVGLSALQHILGDSETMPLERGLFLPLTWRLPPSICQFTSELFYAGKLAPKVGLENQTLVGGPFAGNGVWLREVEHEGNTGSSDEEADEVVAIVSSLLEGTVHWRDQHGVEHPMAPGDIRVVAPFNAHVNKIQDRLAKAGLGDVPTGTVDKFQGQEAPVAIYAMATSHPEDAPRGMEFLYSLNRLNVATSRARCAAIIIACPRLFEPECHTPRQMKLANALCRFREMAETLHR